MTDTDLVHEAAAIVNRQQRCGRCGLVLGDYRATLIPVRGWAPGARILVIDDNPALSGFTDEAPTCADRRLGHLV